MPNKLGDAVPAFQVWLQKSSAWHSRREPLLLHIDNKLAAYGQAPRGSRLSMTLASELYFSLDFWLKQSQRNSSQVTSAREPIITELYKLVVDALCKATLQPVNVLPRWLESTFGKGMGEHGFKKDLEQRSAAYCTAQEVKKYMLTFKDGLAYQESWWINSNNLVKVDTKLNDAAAAEGKTMFPPEGGHQGYVLSMSRDFYMMQHYTPTGAATETGRYHSSYFAGEAVLCAGTLLIGKGQVNTVTTASGHYAPGVTHLYNAVATLTMLGVDLSKVVGWVYGQPAGKPAAEILRNHDLDPDAAVTRYVDERTVGLGYVRRADDAARVRAIAQTQQDKKNADFALTVAAHFKDKGHNQHKCSVCNTLRSEGTFADFWKQHLASKAAAAT